jgi:hypothetical protein
MLLITAGWCNKLNIEEIRTIRIKMQVASKYPHEWSEGRVTIKKMAQYLEAVHPDLYVELNERSTYKDTKYAGSRLRIPGTREYKGYKLKVWKSKQDRMDNPRWGTIIDHDTTETYRRNYEVAQKILKYEKETGTAPQLSIRLSAGFIDRLKQEFSRAHGVLVEKEHVKVEEQPIVKGGAFKVTVEIYTFTMDIFEKVKTLEVLDALNIYVAGFKVDLDKNTVSYGLLPVEEDEL